QEAMLAAYRKWSTVAELQRPDLWVRRVCINVAVSTFRRRMIEVRALTRLAHRREPEPLSEDTEEFFAAVRALPKRQAQAAPPRFVYPPSHPHLPRGPAGPEGPVEQPPTPA